MHRSNKDIILLSILVCLWALQAAVMLQQFLGLWHAPLLINGMLLPEAVTRVSAKWDIVIYIFFIAAALGAGKIVFRYYQKPVNQWLLVFEGVLAFLMVSAVFKIVIYDNSPQLAQRALIALIIISVASKIFYPELKRSVENIYRKLSTIAWAPYADIWWIALIVLMIYMPDLDRVMALIFMGDWLHHFDFIVMSVGWASLFGQVPYADVFSQYGVGLPVIFAKASSLLGGFDYVPVLRVMMWFVIGYFILTYFFVRYWLGSALIAGVAFLLVFRLQMFHYGVSPLVWSVPSASPVRFGLDILWMAALLAHMRGGKSRWLILAAIYSGFALYYMTSGGLCVLATFYFYLAALLILPSLRGQILSDSPKRLLYYLCWVLPPVSALIFFGASCGTYIWHVEFWHNILNYMDVFSLRAALPMFESLKYRHFWAFFMSMVMPFTYLATFLYIGVGLYTQKIKKEWLFTALLCIYGLANYQYYVVRSAITSYYVDVLPFVLIVCFWFMHGLELLPLAWRKRAKAAAVVLSFYALLTNQNYLAYPNLMNFSRNPMTDNLVIQRFPDRQGYFNNMFKNTKEQDKLLANDLGTSQEDMRTEDDFKSDTDLAAYARDHLNFSQDAHLICRLTKPGQRVALISSFETKILIQAHRAPFFYNFPLLSSRPMTFRTFPADCAHLPSYISDTINALEESAPEYVFMEKVFLQDAWPASYHENNSRVLEIISYIKTHYQAFEPGQYLVAMKRKVK